jgi:hypothetical protein
MTSSKRPTAAQRRFLTELATTGKLTNRSTWEPLRGLERLGYVTLPRTEVTESGWVTTGELAVTDAGRAYLASLAS